jgi:hypothetical protein
MKFYVINGTQKTLVNPGGDWKIKPTREDNSIGFRFKFSGSIVLTDKDFDVIRAVELTDKFKKLYLEIWREVDGFYQKFWYGYFTPFTCQWNLQDSRVEFTPAVVDDYTSLIEGFENEKNILEIDAADAFHVSGLGQMETFTVENVQYPDPMTMFVGLSLLYWDTQHTDTDNWILYKSDFTLSGGIWTGSHTIIRMVMYTADVNGAAVPPTSGTWTEIEAVDYYGIPYHKYMRLYSETRALFDTLPDYKITPTTSIGELVVKQSMHTRGRWIADVIQYFLDDFALTLKSDFFQSDVNPVTNEPESPTKFMQLEQKSDAKDPDSTEPAINGFIKFSDLIADLCVAFNLRWWVDGSYFYIEHVSNLPESNNVDATAYSGNYNARAYTYDADNIPRRQTLSFMDNSEDLDFAGLPIIYDAPNTSGRNADNTSDLRVSYMTTDLGKIISAPAQISSEGFLLVSLEFKNNKYVVKNGIGTLTGIFKENEYLSTSNLINTFYNHDMPLPTATVNGELKTFASTQRRRKQENITFPYADIDGFSLVKTELGWGEIDDAELDLKTMLYTTTIKS